MAERYQIHFEKIDTTPLTADELAAIEKSLLTPVAKSKLNQRCYEHYVRELNKCLHAQPPSLGRLYRGYAASRLVILASPAEEATPDRSAQAFIMAMQRMGRGPERMYIGQPPPG